MRAMQILPNSSPLPPSIRFLSFRHLRRALLVCTTLFPPMAALAQDSAVGQWRRICPGHTADTRYFADANGISAGIWTSETPFIVNEVLGDWVLGTRSFDSKRAWVSAQNVCHLDAQRRICEVDQAALFWAPDTNYAAGITLPRGDKVSLVEVSGDWASISFNNNALWIRSVFLCPIDPNVVDAAPPQPAPQPAPAPQPPLQSNGAVPVCGAPKYSFLAMISFAEGTRDRYDFLFGHRVFTSFADHPRRVIRDGRSSDAAGRYQIISPTWDTVIQPNLHLPNFTPPSQDKAAMFLIRNRGVSTIDPEFNYQTFGREVYKLGKEWASLPGSPYGQPVKTMSELWTHYRNRLTCN